MFISVSNRIGDYSLVHVGTIADMTGFEEKVMIQFDHVGLRLSSEKSILECYITYPPIVSSPGCAIDCRTVYTRSKLATTPYFLRLLMLHLCNSLDQMRLIAGCGKIVFRMPD